MRRNEREKLLAFARGEATWAEVEGITTADAARMARTGVELARAGRLREAALVFEAMVEINPRDAGAHAALGTVYQKLGRTEDALVAYGSALARDAVHPVALGNGASCCSGWDAARGSATWRQPWRPILRGRRRPVGVQPGWRRPSPPTRWSASGCSDRRRGGEAAGAQEGSAPAVVVPPRDS